MHIKYAHGPKALAGPTDGCWVAVLLFESDSLLENASIGLKTPKNPRAPSAAHSAAPSAAQHPPICTAPVKFSHLAYDKMTSTKIKLAVEHWRRRGVLHDGPDQGPGKTKDTVSQVNGAVREDHFVVSG